MPASGARTAQTALWVGREEKIGTYPGTQLIDYSFDQGGFLQEPIIPGLFNVKMYLSIK